MGSPCGQDNICNLAACSNDPDCPAGVPQNDNTAGHPDSALDQVIGCDDTQSKDIRAVAWNIADDWSNFEQFMKARTGEQLGACVQSRLLKNGDVRCVNEYRCNNEGCKLGFGAGLGQTVNLYQTFFDNIAEFAQADRRACDAAMLTHEFSHTCEHYAEGGPEAREDSAFEYWQTRFPGTSGFDVNKDCGLD
jgi:hypothetical protein